MKQIIEIYGKTLLEAVVIMLLFLFLLAGIQDEHGNKGIFKVIGARFPVENRNYENYKDFDIYRENSLRAAPVLYYKAGGTLHTGTSILTDCIGAVDEDGNEIPFEVIEIMDPSGNSILETYDLQSGQIDFLEAGIYSVKAVAMDRMNKKAVCTIRLPVNE